MVSSRHGASRSSLARVGFVIVSREPAPNKRLESRRPWTLPGAPGATLANLVAGTRPKLADLAPHAPPALVTLIATTALEAYVDAGATVAAEATATDAGTTAPSVAEAQNARGTLAVTAYPWGFVEVDGRELGRSPVRIELTAGEHNVLVRADGIVKRRRVTVAAGRTRELVVPVE